VRFRIGVDIGGTFTDSIVIDENAGTLNVGKSLSTPPNYKKGVIDALRVAAAGLSTTLEELLKQTRMFSLGTTVATNAIMTRSGVRTGLITTRGFEDVIHMARGTSKWAGLPEADIKHVAATHKPEPIVPKELIEGLIERIDRDGEVVCPLDGELTRKQIQRLLDNGVESIAVSLLWSIRNDAHEQEVARIIREISPDIYVALSSEIAPVVGEFERTITTVLDAYIGPVTQRFLKELSRDLRDSGLKPELLVMKADGGSTFVSEVKPVATTHSGPGGGVVSAAYLGQILGYENIITSDVGGTTFDVSLVVNGKLMYSREPSIGRFNVVYPTIDITSIGAGGGSVAWIETASKVLHVGPKSAGAYPGPVCYGFGGSVPTVTDACLALGYLNPGYFLGGRIKLDYDAAVKALEALGAEIGMSLSEVSAGIWQIVNAGMAELVRGLTVRRGRDPRDFLLMAFGGAGPMHCAWYGSELGAQEAVIPIAASTESALGLAVADILHTRESPFFQLLPLNTDEFNQSLAFLEEKIVDSLQKDQVREEDRLINYFLDMKYGLQYHVLRVPIQRKTYGAEDGDLLVRKFDKVYEATYGKGAGYYSAGRYVVNIIAQGIGAIPKPKLVPIEKGNGDASSAIKEKRRAYFDGRFVNTRVYDYDRLRARNVIEGAAVIEARETTVVVRPGQECRVDQYGNLILRL
jgi:N-methylhydantoinase A